MTEETYTTPRIARNPAAASPILFGKYQPKGEFISDKEGRVLTPALTMPRLITRLSAADKAARAEAIRAGRLPLFARTPEIRAPWQKAPTEPLAGTPKLVNLISGECYVTKESEVLTTVLGSCVAVCMRDPFIGTGGMNHFLLPGEHTEGKFCHSARFGAFAIETLINGVLNAGGCKKRLEVKVFGGGNIGEFSARIGSVNAVFVREFLRKEGLSVLSSDLEGPYPRRIRYDTATGRAFVKRLSPCPLLSARLAEGERRILAKTRIEGDVELF